MITQDDFDNLNVAVQQLKETVERQQQQIQNLQTANKNLVVRLNRVDKQQRESFQSMF